MEQVFITLDIEQFEALPMEVQSEFIYFTTALHEATYELRGMEQGLKAIAQFKVNMDGLKALQRIKAKNDWVEKELENWEKYQDLRESVDGYVRRLERIVKSVREV